MSWMPIDLDDQLWDPEMFPKASNNEYPEATDGEDEQGHDREKGQGQGSNRLKQARTLPVRGSAGASGVVRTSPAAAKANAGPAGITAVPPKARPGSSHAKGQGILLQRKATISRNKAMQPPSVDTRTAQSFVAASPPLQRKRKTNELLRHR